MMPGVVFVSTFHAQTCGEAVLVSVGAGRIQCLSPHAPGPTSGPTDRVGIALQAIREVASAWYRKLVCDPAESTLRKSRRFTEERSAEQKSRLEDPARQPLAAVIPSSGSSVTNPDLGRSVEDRSSGRSVALRSPVLPG